MAHVSIGRVPDWPRRMYRITKLALFFWVLASLGSGEGLALEEPGQTVVVFEGEKVSISCNASRGGNTSWLVNGAAAGGEAGGWEVQGGRLVHDNVTGEFNGSTISCGGVEGYLVVRSVPEIAVGPRSVVVNESSTVLLECLVAGGPPLTTRWRKGGALLGAPDGSQLVVANASRVDAGEYSCEITWSYGSSESTPATVTVQYLRLLTQPADQRLLQTDPEAIIVLSCVAEGIPLPTVSLRKGENQIILDGVVAMETVNKTLVISSPTVGDSGHYTCVAENAFGKVESRPAVVDVTVPPVPRPGLSVELSAHSLIANWTLPRDVAIRNAILNSIVTVSESDSGQVVNISSALPRTTSWYEVSGLQAFTRYTVQVEVRGVTNAVSTVKHVTTLESVPSGPPQNIFVTNITNTSAILKWEEPVTPNGVVTMYFVTVDPSNGSGTADSLMDTQLVMVGLPPNTQVIVSVAAATSEGVGPAGMTTFHTLEGVPRLPPAGLAVVDKDSTSAELKWEEMSVTDLHGNLTHYSVVIRHDSTIIQRLQTNQTSVVVTGLNKFALHHVQVFAETSAGPGPNAFLFLFTESAAPGNDSAVVNLTATPTGPTSVTVRWSPPVDDINGNVTGYLLSWDWPGGRDNMSLTNDLLGDLNVDVLEYNLTRLRPFTNYSIEMQVVTDDGSGETGPPVFVQTEESEPSEPLNVAAMTTDNMVELSWQQPENPNGVLVQFEYQIWVGSVVQEGNVSSNTVNTSVTLQQGPPGAPPSNVMVGMVGSRMATISWDPPPRESRHGIITGYRVALSVSGSEETLMNHSTTQLVLRNLTPYTNYTVRVAAVTVERGNFSQLESFCTATEKIGDAPRSVTLQRVNESTLNVSWRPPTMPNGPLLGYRVSWTAYPHKRDPTARNTTMTWLLLSELEQYTQYRVVVNAYSNVHGDGPDSTVVGYISEVSPDQVNLVEVLTYADEVQLKWTPPTRPVGPLTGYSVLCSGNHSLDETATSHICGGLTPNSTYNVSIIAENMFGSGKRFEKTVKTACEYKTPKVTGVQFDLPQCGSSPSFRYILVAVQELLGEPLRPLNNYTVPELLAITRSIRQADSSRSLRQADSSRSLRQADSSRSLRQVDSSSNSQPYVAANLTWQELGEFRLGDDVEYGGFLNRPLRSGADYETTLFGERFDGMIIVYSPQKFSVPVETDIGVVVYVIIGVCVVLALVLVLIVIVITCICVSLCRSVKEEETFGGFTRKSSFRMSLKKTKLVDPLEQFRATHPWPSLESHPPVPLSGFQSRMTVLQADSNFHFIQEYEGVVVPEEQTYSTEAASSTVNAPKNRYTNIIPYEHSRVKLAPVKGVQGSDYINANYLDGFMRHKAYIATQGPLQGTVEDFWRLVWEQQSAVIVMLTNVKERSKEKCYSYWPNEVGEEEVYGNINVQLDDANELADFTIRTFSLMRASNQREVRQVKHFQFTAWPDHGVPTYATSMLAFVRRVQAGVQASPDTSGPIIVHCSAGVGRTGTFIVIDSMIRRIVSGAETLDVFGHVTLLRSQRNFMVQTEDQYFFIYEALSEYVTCGNTELGMEDLTEHMEHLGRMVEGEESTYMELEFKHLALEKNDPQRFMSANEAFNKNKNRYVNILPFEANRVPLETIRGVDGSDYINASFIDSYQIQGAFIATQAPLENTIEHFWRMIWQYKSPIIVMLTQLTEQGVEQCARYWPTDHPVQYGDLQVEPLVGRHTPTYSYREFSLTHSKTTQSNSVHTVRHFHFHIWPEVGVPSTGIPLVELIREVTKMYSQLGSLRPIVVHCSSGVGRTGVFIALNIILERMKLEGVVDVFQTVKMLRIQRPAMVQTLEQYQFCYDTTMEVLSRYDSFKSLLRNSSKAQTTHSDVSTFLPTAPASGATFTGVDNDGQPQSSPSPDELA